jgi:hypothetical protein
MNPSKITKKEAQRLQSVILKTLREHQQEWSPNRAAKNQDVPRLEKAMPTKPSR